MTNQVAKKSNTSVSTVINQAITQYEEMVENKRFDTPAGYSFRNAIQQTRFLLNKPIESGANKGKTLMQVCSPESILQSVMEMAQKGLNPAKKQCYFIPFGNSCQLITSYQGNIAMAKRNGQDVEDVLAYPVYKDDEFEVKFNAGKGVLEVIKYNPDITKWDKKNLIGAFAVIINEKGEPKYTEYMTIEQIRSAWGMGAAKGNSPAHREFPDQMALKTVKNRAVKSYVNTSDDSDLITDDTIIANNDREFIEEKEKEANKKELIIEDPIVEEIEIEDEEIDEETGEIISDEEIELTPEQQKMMDEVPF